MSAAEQLLADLIHDLAQPLGNIETSAYCLHRCIQPQHPRALEYLRMIQQQVDKASGLLAAASAELARARAQHVAPVETFELAAAASR
jgi:hypothetical protein